jgi:S-adenosylmethionine hydrolase
VGSNRRAIAIRTSYGIFVGPDNGVFSLILTAEPVNVLEAVTLTNADYQLPRISATFHGRDIFAPAAAHLANGVSLGQLGPRAINLVRLDFGTRTQKDECRIIHIDHFGNLILSLTRHDLVDPERVTFTIGQQVITSLSATFADVEEGQFLAYIGSSRDHVEIAVRNGNAAQNLGLKVGDLIRVNTG